MDIVIHIGLHKTGTTFLQKIIFPKLKNVNFICQYNTTNRNQLLTCRLEKNKVNLISEEGLTRHNFRDNNETSMVEIANRIHKVFPNARIILVLRDKTEWLTSLYKMNCKYDYDYWYDNIFRSEDLSFNSYVEYLQKLFKNVLVLDYALLKYDPKRFVRTICDFIGVKVPEFDNVTIRKSRDLKSLKRIHRLPKCFKLSYYKSILDKLSF